MQKTSKNKSTPKLAIHPHLKKARYSRIFKIKSRTLEDNENYDRNIEYSKELTKYINNLKNNIKLIKKEYR